MVTIVKRIGALSAGKAIAIIMAIIGFLYGLVLAAFSFVFESLLGSVGTLSQVPYSSVPASIPGSLGSFGLPSLGSGSSLLGLLGIAAIVALPILFAIFGFVIGALGALVYNTISKTIGGIEIELGEKKEPEEKKA